MGLGLYLFGAVTKQRDALLEDLRTLVRAEHDPVLLSSAIGDGDGGGRSLWLSLHPAEEPLELRTVGPSKLLASARTSGAGPGYHAYVCELLDQVGREAGIHWQAIDPTEETGDETGYFHHRDRAQLEAQMRGWIREVGAALSRRDPADSAGIAISMPLGSPQVELDGAATALGPRDLEFWARLAADDDAAAQFFPWWEPGTGAGYLLGRALCRMWSDVRWCAPRSDGEEELHSEVLDLLARAHALEPGRPYPFAEWRQLAALNGRPLPDDARIAGAGEPTLGYRRHHLVARPFKDVTVRIHGSFAERFDKLGSWCASGDGRAVWLSYQRAAARDGVEPPHDQPDPVHDQVDEKGKLVQRLRGRRVVTGGDEVRAVTVTVLFVEPTDGGWALETYRSVQLG